ncbi:MAG: peptide chain release factor 2 [Bacilli bacterium]|nr:peptide chain release factor 2 [Bacilli bacterium]
MEKFEIVKYTNELKIKIVSIEKVIKPASLKEEISSLEAQMSKSDFWDDAANATKTINKSNECKETLASFEELNNYYEELQMMLELDDEELYQDADNLIKKIDQAMHSFEEKLLLNGEYDSNNAIIELHPGAGGTESQDWTLMLYRMYKRFSERRGFVFELLDYQEAIDAGIKSVSFLIKGSNAYGILKSEHGVHRLVRISPFDSNARRHTSFSACHVTPEIDDNIDIEINENDLRIDTYRSSGAGGQHVNKTDSAVRITHLPTGIVVSCQNQRSQIQNREKAMQVLKTKLYLLEEASRKAKISGISGNNSDNAFGSQIRSYVLHPYAMVKDHRTNVESSNPNNVLDGDLDIFIDAYLKYNASK